MVKLKVLLLLLASEAVLSVNNGTRNETETEIQDTDYKRDNLSKLPESIKLNKNINKQLREKHSNVENFANKLIETKDSIELAKQRFELRSKKISMAYSKCKEVCPYVYSPVCAKMIYKSEANKRNKPFYIIMANECELNYAKCHRDGKRRSKRELKLDHPTRTTQSADSSPFRKTNTKFANKTNSNIPEEHNIKFHKKNNVTFNNARSKSIDIINLKHRDEANIEPLNNTSLKSQVDSYFHNNLSNKPILKPIKKSDINFHSKLNVKSIDKLNLKSSSRMKLKGFDNFKDKTNISNAKKLSNEFSSKSNTGKLLGKGNHKSTNNPFKMGISKTLSNAMSKSKSNAQFKHPTKLINKKRTMDKPIARQDDKNVQKLTGDENEDQPGGNTENLNDKIKGHIDILDINNPNKNVTIAGSNEIPDHNNIKNPTLSQTMRGSIHNPDINDSSANGVIEGSVEISGMGDMGGSAISHTTGTNLMSTANENLGHNIQGPIDIPDINNSNDNGVIEVSIEVSDIDGSAISTATGSNPMSSVNKSSGDQIVGHIEVPDMNNPGDDTIKSSTVLPYNRLPRKLIQAGTSELEIKVDISSEDTDKNSIDYAKPGLEEKPDNIYITIEHFYTDEDDEPASDDRSTDSEVHTSSSKNSDSSSSYDEQTEKYSNSGDTSSDDNHDGWNKNDGGGNSGAKVDKEQYQANCPRVCPIRDMMVCAMCQHGIYKTFPSICHLRMFRCYHKDEELQLVSRYPCVMSAPYLSENPPMDPKGRVSEHDDTDRVMRFIRCREKGKLGNGTKCTFDDAVKLNDEIQEDPQNDNISEY